MTSCMDCPRLGHVDGVTPRAECCINDHGPDPVPAAEDTFERGNRAQRRAQQARSRRHGR